VRRISDADRFDQLVLPEYHKEMIRALVKQHFQDKQTGLTNPISCVERVSRGLISRSCIVADTHRCWISAGTILP
jgi:hypothetical protein